MSHDHKSWEEFNETDEQAFASAFYTYMSDKLKPKGSNYTPPKKKRKKKK